MKIQKIDLLVGSFLIACFCVTIVNSVFLPETVFYNTISQALILIGAAFMFWKNFQRRKMVETALLEKDILLLQRQSKLVKKSRGLEKLLDHIPGGWALLDQNYQVVYANYTFRKEFNMEANKSYNLGEYVHFEEPLSSERPRKNGKAYPLVYATYSSTERELSIIAPQDKNGYSTVYFKVNQA